VAWSIVGALAVWRVTHLLVAESGPFDVFARLRRMAPGRLFDCFYCLSVWVAAPLAALLVDGWRERLLLWPALSAGAILLERVTRDEPAAPAAPYTEDPEVDDVLLRKPIDARPGDDDAGAS
jgi:hypothetical protein